MSEIKLRATFKNSIGVIQNGPAGSVTKRTLQRRYLEYSAVYHIMQNLTRAYGRQLIDIPQKQKLCVTANSSQQHCHCINVNHRQLIHNNEIIRQRIIFVQRERRKRRIIFYQFMNCLGFLAG